MFRRGGDDDQGGGAGPNVYQMRQQMLAIGDDFWIENGAGPRQPPRVADSGHMPGPSTSIATGRLGLEGPRPGRQPDQRRALT